MSNPLVVRLTVRKRLREGPLGSSLDALASSLHAQGYTANTISEYLFAGNRFSRWLTQRQIALSEVNKTTVARYVRQCGRLPSGRLPKAARGLHHIVTLLREQGVAPLLTAPVLLTEQGQWLSRYEHYLRTVRGVAESTCDVYLRLAQRFLTSCFPTDRVDWQTVTARHVAGFVQREVTGRHGAGRKEPAVAVRALLRFVVFSGERPPGLEGAVPMPRQWTHAGLPAQLTATEVVRVLAKSKAHSPAALRNYAILLLLARLGLRAGEVARLCLEDLDWQTGQLVVRPGKTHQARSLPLSQEVGDAVVAYLTKARPPSPSRYIFLCLHPPFRPFVRACGVSRLVHRALVRAGILARSRMGAHLFRHTAASAMVRHGATFKEVADVLGHRSLQTTGIYAKLDLTALTAVALPWVGGAQ